MFLVYINIKLRVKNSWDDKRVAIHVLFRMSLDERTGSEETLHEPYEFDDPEIDETENGNFYCETCGRSVPLGMRHGPQSCTGGMIDFPEELDPADAQRVHDETLQAWSTARLEVKRTIEEITRIRDDVKVADVSPAQYCPRFLYYMGNA